MNETRRLGASNLTVSSMGVGVWSWGDTSFWGYGNTYSRADVLAAYKASLDAGIDFFDTAEIYGQGNSEKLLGWCTRQDDRPVKIASKFAPFPMRFSPKRLLSALDDSLSRIGINELDLYQIHWPYTLLKIEDLMDYMAEAVKAGKIKAVGVSNYNEAQMRRAHARLATHGIPLASNQVHYNLLHRKPEQNGVLKTCRELDVALIAYSPLEQGILTSRFADGQGSKPTSGVRRFSQYYRDSGRQKIQPLLDTLSNLAKTHEKSVEQVALNWLLCKDELVIPIPGAKSSKQAIANAGALGWRLGEAEVAQLDGVASF